MKFLHVIGSMNPRGGGPGMGIRNLATHALEQGHALEVVCLDDANSDYLAEETLSIHALGKGRKPWNYHPALRQWLGANISRFDALILNGLWQYQGYALSRATLHPGAPPYFVFPHGMLDPWFQLAPERRLKAIRNWFYWKFIEQHVVRNAEAIFFTCDEEMRLARDTFRPYRPKRQINVGYGATAPPEYRPGMKEAFAKKCPGLKGKPYFLFLGRIHHKKGVDYLIKAYAALCRSTGGLALPNLVIAGPGLDERYGREMQKLAAQICPADSVFWPGMLTGDAKWGACYDCEASVLPSNQENFGISVAETLACGRPVLISNQVNIWREIQESGAALVENNSVEGTTQLLARWNNLPSNARLHMAARARPCFERHFSIESMSRQLLSAVTSVIKH